MTFPQWGIFPANAIEHSILLNQKTISELYDHWCMKCGIYTYMNCYKKVFCKLHGTILTPWTLGALLIHIGSFKSKTQGIERHSSRNNTFQPSADCFLHDWKLWALHRYFKTEMYILYINLTKRNTLLFYKLDLKLTLYSRT